MTQIIENLEWCTTLACQEFDINDMNKPYQCVKTLSVVMLVGRIFSYVRSTTSVSCCLYIQLCFCLRKGDVESFVCHGQYRTCMVIHGHSVCKKLCPLFQPPPSCTYAENNRNDVNRSIRQKLRASNDKIISAISL